jgi:hypothetical protein
MNFPLPKRVIGRFGLDLLAAQADEAVNDLHGVTGGHEWNQQLN